MCPVCTSDSTRSFFEEHNLPVREGYLAPTAAEAIACDRGDITLFFCSSCGHIWNNAFDADKLRFDPEYDVSMFHSAAYRTYIAAAIDRLKSRYALEGKVALEIACGKGDFLRALVAGGFDEVIGFDPTFIESNLSDDDRKNITAYRAFYDESHRGLATDLVACRSALQYFSKPRELMKSVRHTLGDQLNTIVYFEVPNADETFARQMVWNIAYEHGCFFSAASLARLFRECGFEVLDVLAGLGGSQLEIEARPARSPKQSTFESSDAILSIERAIDSFAALRRERVADWSARLESFAAAGERIALWGAGARAISFLCAIQRSDIISAAVDINPKRQGRFLPKSGVPVISPDQLNHGRFDRVIVTNPNFAAEIRSQIESMGMRCAIDVLQ